MDSESATATTTTATADLETWWFVCTTPTCFRAFNQLMKLKLHKCQAKHNSKGAGNVQVLTTTDLMPSISIRNIDLTHLQLRTSSRLPSGSCRRIGISGTTKLARLNGVEIETNKETSAPADMKLNEELDVNMNGADSDSAPIPNSLNEFLKVKEEVDDSSLGFDHIELPDNDGFLEFHDVRREDQEESNKVSSTEHLKWKSTSQALLKKSRLRRRITSAVSRYKCKLCEMAYAKHRFLVKHIANCHTDLPYVPDPPTFPCLKCNVVFDNGARLKYHKSQEHGGKTKKSPRICPKCGKTFKARSALDRHLSIEHAVQAKTHPCDICGRTCYPAAQLRQHRITHLGREEMEAIPKPFLCPICGLAHQLKSGLNLHFRLVHSDERPFNCSQCKASFKLRNRLRDHMASHSTSPLYACADCGESFRSRGTLRRHVQQGHRERQPKIHNCITCGLIFSGVPSLKMHRIQEHGARGNLHPCQKCEKVFPTKGQLRQHVAFHQNEKDHQCTVCGKRFNTIANLVGHSVWHLPMEERKCVCELCGKRFTLAHLLRKHTRRMHPDVTTPPVRQRVRNPLLKGGP